MVCTRGFQRCFSACVFALNGSAAFYKKGVTVQLAVVKPTPLHPRLKNLANAGVPFVILTLLDMVFRSMTQPSVVSRLAVLVDIGYTWYIPTYTRYICIHIAVSKCSKTNPYISHIRKASSYSITNKNYLYVYIYIYVVKIHGAFELHSKGNQSPIQNHPNLFASKTLGCAELFAGCKSICGGFRQGYVIFCEQM